MPRRLLARAVLAVAAAALAVAAVAFAMSRRQGDGAHDSGRSPARLTARSGVTRHFEYVVSGDGLYVYSIDDRNRQVQEIALPQLDAPSHGVVASPRTGMLYVAYGSQGPPGGSLLAYDLVRGRVRWTRHYRLGVDSMAIDPAGRRLFMPAGEATTDGTWRVIDARTGRPTGAVIHAGAGAHNTIASADGRFVYLAGVDTPYLEMASTATDRVVRRIGPLNPPGVRPFTIDDRRALTFTTARSFLGFQVGSARTGRVLYTVGVPGFSFDARTFKRTPDHGISLSPDGRELYLIDTPNGYVHVFDVAGLPSRAPRDVADIKLAHPPPNDGWLQHSRDGRYVYVGRAGDVIDTRTRRVVKLLEPMQLTADFLEVDWRHGRPVATTSRYGVAYAH